MSELDYIFRSFGSEIEEALRENDFFKVSLDLRWNYTNKEIIKRKGITKELNLFMAKTFASYCERYVPYKTGRLTRSVRVYASGRNESGRVVWSTKYAEAQYDDPRYAKKSTWHHPLATMYWDRVAWQNHGTTITNKVDKERRRLSKG